MQVFEDEADFGLVYVFEEDGTFLCKAISPDRAGADRSAVAAERKAQQKKFIAEGQKELKAAAKALPLQEAVDAVMRKAAEDSGKLVAFPGTSETSVSTPALDEAAKVVALPTAAKPEDRSEERAKFLADFYAPKPEPETPDQRFARAYDLEQDIKTGKEIDEQQRAWLEGYRNDPEYRSRMMMIENFGADAILRRAL